MKRNFSSMAILMLCLLGLSSNGAPTKPNVKNAYVIKPEDFKIETLKSDYNYMTDEEYAAFKKDVLRRAAARSPQAKMDFSDPKVRFTSDYLNMQSKLIGGPIYEKSGNKTGRSEKGVSSSQELASLIEQANDEAVYAKLEPDAKFIVAALATMKPYQGLAFRARPLFERSHLVHAYVIFGMRMAATGINVFLPTPQWKAGFDYVSQPKQTRYVHLSKSELQDPKLVFEKRTSSYISDELSFYTYVRFEVLPSLNLYIKRLNHLVQLSATPGFNDFYFDNTLMYSTANFVDDHDRVVRIGEAELRLALGNALNARSAIQSSLAYSWTNLFKAMEGTARNFGFQSIFNVDLTTAEARNRQIRQPGLLKLQSRDAMAEAYKDLKEATLQTYYAWKAIKVTSDKLGNSNSRDIVPLLDPRVIMPFSRQIDSSMATLASLFDVREVEGSKYGKVSSAVVNGEFVFVDLYKFFNGENVPTDLLAFMPDEYEKDEPKVFKPNRNGKPLEQLAYTAGGDIRNYYEGSPKGWNLKLYNTYFPNVKTNKDVQNVARVLSQVWGGWVIGFPLSAMVL